MTIHASSDNADSKDLNIEWSIYTLADPRCKTIRYVGITASPLAVRYAGHISERSSNEKKQAWLDELRRCGRKPIMRRVALFDGTRREAEGAEFAWMDLLESKFGAKLCNIQKKRGREASSAGSRALRVWMDGRDLTQARAASLLNEKQAVISRWLLGVMPRIDKAVRIERLTGVPVTDWAKS